MKTPLRLITPFLMVALVAPAVLSAKPAADNAPKSVDQAVALARKENKLVFIQVGRKNCGNCRALKAEIQADRYHLPSADFVHVELDCDSPVVMRDFTQRFKVQGSTLPFVVISDGKGKALANSSGFVSKEKFDELVKTARQASGRTKSKPAK